MKIVVIIARVLLGLMFVVFGLNGFLQFMKMPPPEGLAGDFHQGDKFVSHYFYVVSALQVVGACCCWSGALCHWGSRCSAQ